MGKKSHKLRKVTVLSDDRAEKMIHGRLWQLVDSVSVKEEEASPFLWDTGFGEKQKTQASSLVESSHLYQQQEMERVSFPGEFPV